MKDESFRYYLEKFEMRMKPYLILFTFICLVPSAYSQSYIGEGWASTSINAVSFRKNSVVTHQDNQYAAYYDSSGHVVLAKRKLDEDKWTVHTTDYKGNVKDAHNTISIMVDGDGYLHMGWDHHNNPLNYCQSAEPGSLLLTEKRKMIGRDEEDVTYPEFHRMPSGDLIFLYRSGVSGRGNLVMNRYDVKQKKWFRIHDVLIDGEGERNAYWQFYIDNDGTLHLSWVWRETSDVATNHDLCYARSKDNGETWEKSTGELYHLPITQANAEYAMKIPQSSELINQTSMSADQKGRPYIATYWRDRDSTIPQYRVVYHDGRDWRHEQVGNRTTPFSLSGGGTKKIPISRPQILVTTKGNSITAMLLFRDVERGSKVSLAINKNLGKGDWKNKDLTDYSVNDWEPTYDTEYWRQSGRLCVFVQKVGQGDGEKLDNVEPQSVFVLDFRP